eukprot:3338517-Rhodomonas_salina.2
MRILPTSSAWCATADIVSSDPNNQLLLWFPVSRGWLLTDKSRGFAHSFTATEQKEGDQMRKSFQCQVLDHLLDTLCWAHGTETRKAAPRCSLLIVNHSSSRPPPSDTTPGCSSLSHLSSSSCKISKYKRLPMKREKEMSRRPSREGGD